jgi:hypothetical protein
MDTRKSEYIMSDGPEKEVSDLLNDQAEDSSRGSWWHPNLAPEDQGLHALLRLFWFLPASLLLWAAYFALMMALGGRNPAYATELERWNFARWLSLPSTSNGQFYPRSALVDIFALTMLYTTISSSDIFSAATYYAADDGSRHGILFRAFCMQIAGFWSMMIVVHFASNVVLSVLMLRMFQAATIVAWFVIPFLAYRLTALAVSWLKRRQSASRERIP